MTQQATADPLTSLAMWDKWQTKVLAALPKFAASPWYLEQDSLKDDEVNDVVEHISVFHDLQGKARDVRHGARAFQTQIGTVTRAWVDSQIEIDFLRRRLGPRQHVLSVLDIGAGYGRLAGILGPIVASYTCVDAVPVSVEVCREYTQRYAPMVRVLDIAGLRAEMAAGTLRPTLAINIHSWNECGSEQIGHWLDALEEMQVPFLFTVSHGQNADVFPSGRTPSGTPVEPSYRTWGPGLPSFKPLLAERYELVAEESIGISRYPHALWRWKKAP